MNAGPEAELSAGVTAYDTDVRGASATSEFTWNGGPDCDVNKATECSTFSVTMVERL